LKSKILKWQESKAGKLWTEEEKKITLSLILRREGANRLGLFSRGTAPGGVHK